MLMIAAALMEELETALSLCRDITRLRVAGASLSAGTHGAETVHFLKLGVGPERSASSLRNALEAVKPSRILVIGYAGALDPDLKKGDLVILTEASLLSGKPGAASVHDVERGPVWKLAETESLSQIARAASLPTRLGNALTSYSIVGAPEDKRILFEKFRAAIVDMETAELARIAAGGSVPLSSVRAVTDAAGDDLFSFLPYDPEAGTLKRAAGALAAGGWLWRYNQWRECSRVARQSLGRFLEDYLDGETTSGS